MARILCLDDEAFILKSLQRLLQGRGMQTTVTMEPEKALALLQQHHFDVLICDMRMPTMSGAEFFARARDIRPDTQRILLTGFSDFDAIVDAVNQGQIHLYLNKPWHNEELLLAVQKAVDTSHLIQHAVAQQAIIERHNRELESRVEKRTAQLRALLKEVEKANRREQREHKETFEVLYNFVNANPFIDGRLAKNIAHTCGELARAMGLDKEETARCKMAGYLSQIGLLAMDPELSRVPFNELTQEQRRHYMTHPATARLMLMPASHLDGVAQTIACQYEHINGSGLPGGLKGSEIPRSARILSVARDFWQTLEASNKIGEEASNIAKERIVRYQGSIYCPEVSSALNGLGVDALVENYRFSTGLKILCAHELKPGLVLAASLYSHGGIQLLPRGHVFGETSITRLKKLETDKPTPFRIMVKNV